MPLVSCPQQLVIETVCQRITEKRYSHSVSFSKRRNTVSCLWGFSRIYTDGKRRMFEHRKVILGLSGRFPITRCRGNSLTCQGQPAWIEAQGRVQSSEKLTSLRITGASIPALPAGHPGCGWRGGRLGSRRGACGGGRGICPEPAP